MDNYLRLVALGEENVRILKELPGFLLDVLSGVS
jgi:hypothetical protein